MPSRQNPYYAGPSQSGAIADIFNTMGSSIKRMGSGRTMGDVYNMARAVGESDRIIANRTPPEALGALMASGGQLPPGAEGSLAEIFARGLQELAARGYSPDQLGKMMGQGGYIGNVNAGNADAAMPYIPLFGSNPTTSTALTPEQQDRMSARDSRESIAQAVATEAMKNQGAMDRKVFDAENPSPGTPMDVSTQDGAGLAESVKKRLSDLDMDFSDAAVDAVLTEAAKRYQTSRNAVEAVDSVIQDLRGGNMDSLGVQSSTKPGFMGFGEKTTVDRVQGDAPPPPPETPAPKQSAPRVSREDQQAALQQARDAIARGADREAVAQRLRDYGIDPSLLSAPDLPAFNGL